MTYDRAAQWDLQGGEVGAKQKCLNMDQWQRKWLEPFCLVGFLLFSSKGTKLAAPVLDATQRFTEVLILWVSSGIQREGEEGGRMGSCLLC